MSGAELAQNTPAHRQYGITPREWHVLTTLAVVGSQGEVAALLGISYQTVKNHMSSVHDKVGEPTTIGVYRKLGWLRIPRA